MGIFFRLTLIFKAEEQANQLKLNAWWPMELALLIGPPVLQEPETSSCLNGTLGPGLSSVMPNLGDTLGTVGI